MKKSQLDYKGIRETLKTLPVDTLPQIGRAARILLDMCGLEDWGFEWSNAKRYLGLCSHKNKKIILSKYLVKRMNPKHRNEIRLTLVHEIAHALTPGNRHGRLWQATDMALGGTGERCYDYVDVIDTEKVDYNWHIACVNCDREWNYHRLNRRIKKQLEIGLRRCPCGSNKFDISDLRG